MDNIKKLEARKLITRPTKKQRKRDIDITWMEPELPAKRFEKLEELHKYKKIVERDVKQGY
eukprot:2661498-Ditylum_brightwellii.AAC.1